MMVPVDSSSEPRGATSALAAATALPRARSPASAFATTISSEGPGEGAFPLGGTFLRCCGMKTSWMDTADEASC